MPDRSPLVTIITVSYQSAAYIRDAIESVLAQDYPNLEYIIHDDCSSDESWNIIQSYTDSRIRVFRNETNLGEYRNRAAALEKAGGEYLIFIDGDDLIYPYGISFFVQMMENFPEAGMAIQKNYHRQIVFPALLTPRQSICNYYFGERGLLVSSFASNFFRTDWLRKAGGLRTDLRTGDVELRLRMACLYPVLLVAGWVSWPRETPGQLSSKLNEGTAALEKWEIYRMHVAAGLLNIVENKINKGILLVIKASLWRESMLQLANGRWRMAGKLLKISGFSFIRSSTRAELRQYDFLSQYSPEKPLKRRFLP